MDGNWRDNRIMPFPGGKIAPALLMRSSPQFVQLSGNSITITGYAPTVDNIADPWPTFNSGIFTLADTFRTFSYTGFNTFFRFKPASSELDLPPVFGNFSGQFATSAPAGLPFDVNAPFGPYKYYFAADLGPDTPNATFPNFQTMFDLGTSTSLGFGSQPIGVEKTMNTVVEIYASDGVTVLARAKYGMAATRTA